jgi:Zn-finger protein
MSSTMAKECKPMIAGEDGWSEWVQPTMGSYLMQCCDCGLIHEMQFGVLRKGADLPDGSWEAHELPQEEYRVEFRARRTDQIGD